jgi:Holliday junction DNA helicase RuvB
MTEETGDVMQAASFDDYVGQEPLKRRLSVHIQAALTERRMLDHVFLAGPPGFGKTALARIIAAELGDAFASITLPVKPAALIAFFQRWEGPGVVLLDEIHRATPAQQEDLLNLLQEGYVQTLTAKRIEVPNLTVIGATTEPDKVIQPLYDRFPIKPTFVDYTDEDMAMIVIGMADKIDLDIEPDLALALGQAAGGTPRNARQLVLAFRDLFASLDRNPTAAEILDLCNIEPDGLTAAHVSYLKHLSDLGGHAGLSLLASMLRLHPSIVCNLERLLVGRGLVLYGTQGRELTQAGFRRVSRHGLHAAAPSRLQRVAQG